jgi:hypothetical protein
MCLVHIGGVFVGAVDLLLVLGSSSCWLGADVLDVETQKGWTWCNE